MREFIHGAARVKPEVIKERRCFFLNQFDLLFEVFNWAQTIASFVQNNWTEDLKFRTTYFYTNFNAMDRSEINWKIRRM